MEDIPRKPVYTLMEFVTKFKVLIPDSERDTWRAVHYLHQEPCDLKGQDFQGVVVPRITNGVHAWVEHIYDIDRRPTKVCCSNLIYRKRPVDSPTRKFTDAEPRNPRAKKERSVESILSAFGLSS